MQPAVCPSAPDFGQMEKIPGYEGVGFEDGLYNFHKFPNFHFIKKNLFVHYLMNMKQLIFTARSSIVRAIKVLRH